MESIQHWLGSDAAIPCLLFTLTHTRIFASFLTISVNLLCLFHVNEKSKQDIYFRNDYDVTYEITNFVALKPTVLLPLFIISIVYESIIMICINTTISFEMSNRQGKLVHDKDKHERTTGGYWDTQLTTNSPKIMRNKPN